MTTSPPEPAPSLSLGAGSPWAELAAGFAPVLAQAAGPGAFLVSVTLEVAKAAPAGPPRFAGRLERATRTLAFVSGEARGADGALQASASAVFTRG